MGCPLASVELLRLLEFSRDFVLWIIDLHRFVFCAATRVVAEQ